MSQVLLAAEADKIQHFVFRSTRLREVVGGSQLLSRFCDEAAPKLLPNGARLLVNDGGSFTALLPDEEAALAFGAELARLYYDTTNATLTVGPPVPWDGTPGTFPAANDAARAGLARAKRAGRGAAMVEIGPHMAICASCGVEQATLYTDLEERADGQDQNYVCRTCRLKAQERRSSRSQFLSRFEDAVVAQGGARLRCPHTAEDIADWDPRGYVAYLIADGNKMGKVFSSCPNPETLKKLSESMTDVLRESLAEPTLKLLNTQPGQKRSVRSRAHLSVLPLILGGDDLFVLLPAPYALDFARSFCRAFAGRMKEQLNTQGLPGDPSMSAAVVICKAKYPHTLVHKHGHALLERAKRLVKAPGLGIPAQMGIVDFDVLLGHSLPEEERKGMTLRSSLRPYWVPRDVRDPIPDGLGLPVDVLINERYNLRAQVAGQLAELRALYSPNNLPSDDQNVAKTGRWQAQQARLVGRIARDDDRRHEIDAALAALGGSDGLHAWYALARPSAVGKAHGLLDLLQVWNYSFAFEHAYTDYFPGED